MKVRLMKQYVLIGVVFVPFPTRTFVNASLPQNIRREMMESTVLDMVATH